MAKRPPANRRASKKPAKIHVEPTGAHDLDGKLIRDAIEVTRLTHVQFARFIVREPRSIRSWAEGDYPLPTVVRNRILEILATNPEDREIEIQDFIVRCQRGTRTKWESARQTALRMAAAGSNR